MAGFWTSPLYGIQTQFQVSRVSSIEFLRTVFIGMSPLHFSPYPAQLSLSCHHCGSVICKRLKLLTRNFSHVEKCGELDFTRPTRPKVKNCALVCSLLGRIVDMDAPGQARCPCFPPHTRPGSGYAPGENSDNRLKPLIWGAWGARFLLFVCFFLCGKRRADAYAPETAIFAFDVLGEGQTIPAGVFQQELAELLLCDGRFQIILAPLGVGAIEVCGTLFTVRMEADVKRFLLGDEGE